MNNLHEEILPIIPPSLPFGLDDKIFHHINEDSDEEYREPYSLNDFSQSIKDIAGVNPELLS